MGGAFGAVRGAKGVVHKHVAQGGKFFGQFRGVFLFADVDTAVFQQHDLAGLHRHTIDPVGHQRHLAAQQFAESFGHRGQRVFGFEGALGGAAQVAGDHHGSARIECHLDARHAGADAGVFGDVAGVVLRHIEVGADKNPLACCKTAGNYIGKT